MRIVNVHEVGIEAAAKDAALILEANGLVIYPTETTYGLAVDVESSHAVGKLLDYKGKRDGKPISVAVADQVMAKKYVKLNPTAKQAYKTFLPGPVTIVSTGKGITAPGIASPEGKVGIRISSHELAQAIPRVYGKGISATGANVSNKKRPYSVQDILDNTTRKQQEVIDLILDAGELPHNPPSTVIDTTLDDLTILRSGVTKLADSELFVSKSREDTLDFMMRIGSRYRSYYGYTPVIFALEGEMGAGKTQAVKGLAKGIGIDKRITSPTYTFSNEYTFKNEDRELTFAHIDAWRMSYFGELVDIGWDTMIQNKGVIALEWSDKFSKILKTQGSRAKVIYLRLERGDDYTERRIYLQEQ